MSGFPDQDADVRAVLKPYAVKGRCECGECRRNRAEGEAALARLATRLDEQEKARLLAVSWIEQAIGHASTAENAEWMRSLVGKLERARSALGTGSRRADHPEGSVSSSPGEGEPRDG